MRSIALIIVVSVSFHLLGCGPLPDRSVEEAHGADDISDSRAGFLSPESRILLLSTIYGVCARDIHPLRSYYYNGIRLSDHPTVLDVVGLGKDMKVSVGKIGVLLDTDSEEVSPTALPRKIRIAKFGGRTSVMVSDFEGAGDNQVGISWEGEDSESMKNAILLANRIVSCQIIVNESK